MTWSSFLVKLASITILLMVTVVALARLYGRSDLLYIYQSSTFVFVLFCLVVFWYARLIARSRQDFTFFGVVSGSFMVKLVGAIAFLYAYQEWIRPKDEGFAIHFIIVYLVYTAYEVYFLTKLAKAPDHQ